MSAPEVIRGMRMGLLGRWSAGWHLLHVVLMACMLMIALGCSLTVSAQQSGWGRLEHVSDIGSDVSVAIDGVGRAHAMWTADSTEDSDRGLSSTLFYARLDRDGWTASGDVIVLPGGRAADNPALLYGSGRRLHLFWRSGGVLGLASAQEDAADSAQGWSIIQDTTQEFDLALGTRAPFDVVEDALGVMHLVFVTVSANQIWEIKYSSTEDFGQEWTEPVTITASPDQSSLDTPRLAVSPDGTNLHVVWTEMQLPDGWPPLRVMVSGSGDQGITWSAATELGGDNQGWPGIVYTTANEVHVVWNGSGEQGGRRHAVSSDGGATWLGQMIDKELGGLTSGSPVLVEDSAGVVHAVMFADRDSAGQEIFYTAWIDGAWTSPIVISDARSSGLAARPSAVLRNGNELLALWANGGTRDGRDGWSSFGKGIWYRHQALSSPEVVPTLQRGLAVGHAGEDEAAPTVGLSVLSVESATSSSTSPAPENVDLAESVSIPRMTRGLRVALGVFPSALLIMIVLAIRFKSR